MLTVYFILLLLAGVCFGLAAGRVALGKVDPLALGLLFWLLVPFLQVLQRL